MGRAHILCLCVFFGAWGGLLAGRAEARSAKIEDFAYAFADGNLSVTCRLENIFNDEIGEWLQSEAPVVITMSLALVQKRSFFRGGNRTVWEHEFTHQIYYKNITAIYWYEIYRGSERKYLDHREFLRAREDIVRIDYRARLPENLIDPGERYVVRIETQVNFSPGGGDLFFFLTYPIRAVAQVPFVPLLFEQADQIDR